MSTDCKERLSQALKDRLADLRAFAETGFDDRINEDGNREEFNSYGLCFDYVPRGTFEGQRRGYYRYQLSWGGPGDEFRFYCDETRTPVKIEYWFLDWFDGASKRLTGINEALLVQVFDLFEELEMVGEKAEAAYA